MSYNDNLYEKWAEAYRQDLPREAQQQLVLAHFPQQSSSWMRDIARTLAVFLIALGTSLKRHEDMRRTKYSPTKSAFFSGSPHH